MSSRRQPQRIPPPIDHGAEAFTGETILQEISGDLALLLWKTVRTVRLWAGLEPSGCSGAFTPGARERRLALLEAVPVDPQLGEEIRRASLVLGAGEADPVEISSACQQIAEWAKRQEALGTALEFMQTAAFADPTNSALAREVAILARQRGEYARAESWFRRAISVARRTGDYVIYTRSFLGVGKIHRLRGNLSAARNAYIRALRASRRRANRELMGMAYHDLATLGIVQERPRDVERYARAALDAYGPGHRWLPILAYDVAVHWMMCGYFKEATQVFRAIPSELGSPAEQLVRAAALVRSAAAADDRESYRVGWQAASRLLGRPAANDGLAIALVNLAQGAESAGDWDRAEAFAERAHRIAARRGEVKSEAVARGVIESVRHARRIPQPTRETESAPPRSVSRFATDLSVAIAPEADER